MANQERINSNSYTVVFAVFMALIIGVVLALVSSSLQGKQDINAEFAMKKNLLNAVGLDAQSIEKEEVNTIYETKFTGMVVNNAGKEIGDKAAAFVVDMAKEAKKDDAEKSLPVFIYKDDNGKVQYILQARGSGLWDAIWVYLALAEDKNTISGAVFGHKAETPGLGAKIKDDAGFYADFSGKQLFKGDDFVGITVLKGEGGNVKANASANQVDGISGATMTCNGVTSMMQGSLANYLEFLKQ